MAPTADGLLCSKTKKCAIIRKNRGAPFVKEPPSGRAGAPGAGGARKSKIVMNPNQPLPFDPEFLVKRAAAEEEGTRRRPRRRTGPRMAVGAPGYLSVRRAAEVLGIQPRSVIYLLANGLLKSQRLGRAHFLPVAEVERYRRVRRDRANRARLNRTRTRRIKLVR
jgi:hypothetical protein